MRSKPYSFALKPTAPAPPAPETPAPTAEATATASPSWRASVVDLSDILNQKPAHETTTAPLADTDKTTDTTQTQAAQETTTAPDSVTFEDGFEKFKTETGKKLADFVENPEDFAKMFVKFGNLGRIILLPGIYTKVMFPAEERNDLKAMLEKRIAAEKQNKEPEFNNYEKRLFAKYQKLEAAKETLSYTEEEITWLAKVVAKRIADLPAAAFLEKYDWAIALAYLEFKHASPILTAKAEDFAYSKLGI